ncbi:hypothetical protein Pogu_0005 [Pyrobaculum oguniense TE7]|uniref:Uncharacterized protein n=1 Tax=Pyrobaculum oguniense (strain DSM 13380 / JCM 10595 / TE7) TaxID=698757 RepID=H6Q602_PYROT|nr:hypothetical protein Pogu_0005 [Pyrobaculum oguniense TE7]
MEREKRDNASSQQYSNPVLQLADELSRYLATTQPPPREEDKRMREIADQIMKETMEKVRLMGCENLSQKSEGLSDYEIAILDALRCFGSYPELICNCLEGGRGALCALAKAVRAVAKRVADMLLDLGEVADAAYFSSRSLRKLGIDWEEATRGLGAKAAEVMDKTAEYCGLPQRCRALPPAEVYTLAKFADAVAHGGVDPEAVRRVVVSDSATIAAVRDAFPKATSDSEAARLAAVVAKALGEVYKELAATRDKSATGGDAAVLAQIKTGKRAEPELVHLKEKQLCALLAVTVAANAGWPGQGGN